MDVKYEVIKQILGFMAKLQEVMFSVLMYMLPPL